MALHRVALPLCMALLGSVGQTWAQLRVVDYNTAGDVRVGMNIVLAAIGFESINGIAKPIDVLALQEQDSASSTTQGIVDVLNGLYGPGVYARGTVDAATSGAGRPGIVYNTQTLQLISQTPTGAVGSSGNARQGMVYRLRPVGYGADADFYVFSNHFKAGTTSTDKSRRNVEAQSIRAVADALPGGSNLIYAGDYNVQSASESAIQTLIAPGNGQAFDPINLTMVSGSPVSWHDNNSAALRRAHTQSPVDPSLPGTSGLITGGMDDRFDFQYVSAGLMDGEGLSYIGPGIGDSSATTASYRAFGNNGTHPLNAAINHASNTAQPANVLNALASVTDHLPVVADYQLPARMSVAMSALPPRVILDANVQASASVSNSANVVAAVGADELNYEVVGSGSLSGSFNGTDAALGGSNLHLFALDTSTPGTHLGAIDATSSSQSVANGMFTQQVSYEVLDHANASFSETLDVNELSLDLGGFFVGGGQQSIPLSIHNLLSAGEFTAKLDIVGMSGSGDVTRLWTDLSATSVDAGSSLAVSALFDTSTVGSFSAQWTIASSDEDLPGAVTGIDLVLNLTGQVTILGDVNFDSVVDIFDVNYLSENWGSAGPAGDANTDGVVDIFDVNLISENWGQTANAGSAVPEPQTLVLLGIVALVGLCSAARRRRSNRTVSHPLP